MRQGKASLAQTACDYPIPWLLNTDAVGKYNAHDVEE